MNKMNKTILKFAVLIFFIGTCFTNAQKIETNGKDWDRPANADWDGLKKEPLPE